MNNKFLHLVTFSALVCSSAVQAQSNKGFAITSDVKGTFAWNTIREIDLTTGETVRTFYDKKLHNNFEIVNNQNARLTVNADNRSQIRLMPMAEGVAASAYDEKHNRLYYTTMRGTELRYFDLNSATGKIVYNQAQPLFRGNRFDEANVITRMAIGSDGNGYALTNDSKNLIKFTTDERSVFTNMGELIDGKKNGTLSIHNLCSSWGGDMVGDAYGNLYLVSMRNHIFKINPQTRVADHVGLIKGLPADYTTNGMAVDAEGDVLLSSAAVAGTYYRLNMGTMEAVPIQSTKNDAVFNASDLAASNLLFSNKSNPVTFAPERLGNNFVSIYPNPVTNKMLTIQFDKVPAGKYNFVLMDASGKGVLARTIVINYFGQVERISLPRTSAGLYMVKLSGSNSKLVFNDKIMVQ
ncbi:MAG: T9SS type A sorting domain-containing protein [Chitinophagaceae bacterium]|nr:T9SS type A sorting domain-containing protein [Chitinophagaceae bacterium]